MIPQRINDATRELGKPVDWDDSKGTCGSLSIRDEKAPYVRMVSEWKPTAEELESLNKGATVKLSICGTIHPPVSVYVEPTVNEMSDHHVEAKRFILRLADAEKIAEILFKEGHYYHAETVKLMASRIAAHISVEPTQ